MPRFASWSDEEKKALKGDNPNLAGYEAQPSDLKANDAVRLRLWRPLKEKTTETAPDSDKDGKATDAGQKKSVVTEIVILNDEKTDKDKSKDSPSKKS